MNTSRAPESVNHSMSAEPPPPTAAIGFREGWAAAIYFCMYLAYLFVSYESELLHWLTLVALPLALVFLLRRGEARRLSNVLACAVLHSLINALPAMTMIKFSGG